MDLAPWRVLLARTLHQHCRQPHSRYFQLATVVDVAIKGEMMAGIVNFANQFDPLGINTAIGKEIKQDLRTDTSCRGSAPVPAPLQHQI